MSIKDIIKNSFLEGFNNSAPNLKAMILCMVVSILLGFYIFLVYRVICSKSFYSRDFNISLVMVSVITCAIILTIQSSVIVSLGMVGALSIVRFRTAVKNSVDLVFMFWAISIGIITGTGLMGLAAFVSLVLSLLVILFRMIPLTNKLSYYVRVEGEDEKPMIQIVDCLKAFDKDYRLQTQNIYEGNMSVTFEINVKNPEKVLEALYKTEGVKAVSLIAHGDNTSV